MQPKTVTIQGMRFRLKPSTRNNVKAFHEAFDSTDPDFLKLDQWEQYLRVLPFVVEPAEESASLDKIVADELDAREVEVAISGFLPNPMRMFNPLAGSSLF